MRLQHVIDPAVCIGCEICAHTCPSHAISELDGRIVVEAADCDQSGQCLDVCPTGAIANWIALGDQVPFSVAEQAAWAALPAPANRSPELLRQTA